MRRFVRESSLSLVFGALFVLAPRRSGVRRVEAVQRRAERRRVRQARAGRLPHLRRLGRGRRGELAVGDLQFALYVLLAV